MTSKAPFFSIIVPCCDVEPYVRECLMSVINQPFKDWECLVGIETSKDRTEEIVHEISDGDNRFKVFTGPRSGSCSASRNTGIDMAQGEYVIFLDGDDTIVEGSLQRLHDKIAKNSGADLYPCAVQVFNECANRNEELRDNYPLDSPSELTGIEASLFIVRHRLHPQPMMQMTLCRREFLILNNLKCIYGLSGQDREFSPRALYLAKRVVPLHEPFYLYRKRSGSVMDVVAKDGRRKFHDQAVIYKSLFAFHDFQSQQLGFDTRLTECWSHSWISRLFYVWFEPWHANGNNRKQRLESLKLLFADGFKDFNSLLRTAPRTRRIAAWWVKLFVRYPSFAWLTDLFFTRVYFPLVNIRDKKR